MKILTLITPSIINLWQHIKLQYIQLTKIFLYNTSDIVWDLSEKVKIASWSNIKSLKFSTIDKNFNQIVLKVREIAHVLGYVAETFLCTSAKIGFEVNIENPPS